MAKQSSSTKNVFKAIQDVDLLDLVDSKNPYFASRPSAAWEEIVQTLNQAKIFKKPLDSRAVINRVNTLVTAFRAEDLKKKVKSGTEEQYGRIGELLTRIVAAIDDSKKVKDLKTQAEAARTKERDDASQAVVAEGETGRSGVLDVDGVYAESLDDEAEKEEFLHEMGGDDNDWEAEKEYRRTKRAQSETKSEEKNEKSKKKVRTSRPTKPSEMELSDDKWIGFFKQNTDRKYALKEAESKRAYDLEAKKLEIRAKELELESRRLDMENKKLYTPLDF